MIQVWVDAALTEDVFMGMSRALAALSPTSFTIQQIAVIASAFAKAKIFDSELFAHLSRAVQWRGRPASQFTVQVREGRERERERERQSGREGGREKYVTSLTAPSRS